MRDVVAVALMVAASFATLAVVVARVLGEPLNWPLFGLGVAAWVLGGALWREE